MKLLVFSAKKFEIPFLNKANNNKHSISYTEDALSSETAMQAIGFQAISIFSGDDASGLVLQKLHDFGIKFIAIRATGFNNIQLKPAYQLGLKIANAPNYSPHAIAEHAVTLLLALNRRLIAADRQVHQNNFLLDNLMGVNLHGKTVGIIGTGNIGSVMAKIMNGFGCNLLATDLEPDNDLVEFCNVRYTDLEKLCKRSDFISLHIPLSYENHSLINKKRLGWMKKEVILINTARGAIVDHTALLQALKDRTIGAYGADVYDREQAIFFRDHSRDGIADEQLKSLLSFNNVLITPHQAFVTEEALESIAGITINNLNAWEGVENCKNQVGYASLPL